MKNILILVMIVCVPTIFLIALAIGEPSNPNALTIQSPTNLTVEQEMQLINYATNLLLEDDVIFAAHIFRTLVNSQSAYVRQVSQDWLNIL